MHCEPDRRFILPAFFLTLVVALASCGPAPPPVGSPAWLWEAAHDTWEAGDLQKTSDHLESLAKSGGEYALQATPWRLVLTGGMARGLMNLAEAFENGARANQAAAVEFRRQMDRFRTQASRQALQFGETYLVFEKLQTGDSVPIAFTYPKGSLMPVAEVTKAGEGMMLSESEVETARVRSLQQGILTLTCSAVGAEDDSAKAQQIFQAQTVTVPRNTFVLAMAKQLRALSELYSSRKLNHPERYELFNKEALDALKTLPESDQTKKLMAAIEKDLKAAEKRP